MRAMFSDHEEGCGQDADGGAGNELRPPVINEADLVEGLAPIRSHFLAAVLFQLMKTGFFDDLSVEKFIDRSDVAVWRDIVPRRLEGMLEYLQREHVLEIDEAEAVKLTLRGQKILELKPWYTLLVGGYSATLAQIPQLLVNGDQYGDRDTASVGEGSCGISQHDALPMTLRLMERLPVKPAIVIDVGCGDGAYLMSLCQRQPDLRGIGIDPDPELVSAARDLFKAQALDDRIVAQVGDALAVSCSIHEEDLDGRPCFLTAFVLQEVLEQSGRPAVLALLQSTFDRYPAASWVVIEVDRMPAGAGALSTNLGLAYYNPYYLIHDLTKQRLEGRGFWLELFREAGCEVVAIEYPDPKYDSLQLKIGFALVRGS